MLTSYNSSKPETMRAFFGQINESQRHTLVIWFCYGCRPGSGTKAVLDNDLHTSLLMFAETPGALLAMDAWLHAYTPCRSMDAWTELRKKYKVEQIDCLRGGLRVFADLGDQVAKDALAEFWGVKIEVPE